MGLRELFSPRNRRDAHATPRFDAPPPHEFLPAPRAQTAEESAQVLEVIAKARTGAPRHKSVGIRFLDTGKTGRLESTWTTTPSTADAIIYRDGKITIARARDAAETNDHARRFLAMVRENVAGPTGFSYKAIPTDINAAGDEIPDVLAGDAIDRAWKTFCEKDNFDTAGILSRAEFERLWAMSLAKDGEAFAMFVYGPDAGPYGFAIQMLDPIFFRFDHNEDLPNGNKIRSGIERSKGGRAIAYHFFEYETLFGGATARAAGQARRIPAEFIVHDFLPEMVGQRRGLSWMRTALARMRHLKGYEDSAVVNARAGAAKMGFFKDPEADPEDNEDLPMDAEPGVFENIGNREFIQYKPDYPVGEFDMFVKSCLRSISSGLLVSYNTLANDLSGVNFSSIRQGVLDERDVWKGLQAGRISGPCLRIYKAWIEYALLAGKITLPSGLKLPASKVEKFSRVTISGRRWTWVDPLKEIAAYERAVALGIKSRRDIIRENSDADAFRVWDELGEEKKEMEKRGIYTPPAGSAAPSGSPNGNGTANNGGGTAPGGDAGAEDDTTD